MLTTVEIRRAISLLNQSRCASERITASQLEWMVEALEAAERVLIEEKLKEREVLPG